jgi:hypothetical protein
MSESQNKDKTKEKTTDRTKDEILEKLKDIKNKIDTTHLESLERLKNLEDKIDTNKKESSERFTELESQIDINKRESKKESFAISEDQLFFTLIISLLVLFITLPANYMASFLQNVFHTEPSLALADAGNIKYFGIVLFLVSSVIRYCAVFGNQNVSKLLRFISFESLWLELDIFILIVVINLSTILSPKIGISGLSVTFLILTLIFVGMLMLERYILKIYAEKELISKENSPYASRMILTAMLALTIALLVELVALALGKGISPIRFILVYIITVVAVLFAPMIKSTNRKKKK